MTAQVGSRGRSSLLFVMNAFGYLPCNLERPHDGSADERDQQDELLKRHGASPLSALERPGEQTSKKSRPTGHPGASGKESRLLSAGHSALIDNNTIKSVETQP